MKERGYFPFQTERHAPVHISIRTDPFTLETAQRFVDELAFPGTNAAIVEFMMTARRFHVTFPTAAGFILEYPNYGDSDSRANISCFTRPINWHARWTNGHRSSLLDISVPKHLAHDLKRHGQNHYQISLTKTAEIFAIEGALMQSAIAFGGSVLLPSGYDTGYSVISLGEWLHLAAQRLGLFKA